jgi:hypothetical protein
LASSNGLLALLVCAGFMVACQGDQGIPSEPGRELDLTAGGPCKNAAFTSAATIYTDSNVQNTKLQACKDILGYFKHNSESSNAQGERGIDDLLVAIYTDYHNNSTTPTLTPVGSSSLAQSVANYISAACGLAGTNLSASECLVPHDVKSPIGIDHEDLKAWGAWGPLTGALEKGLLPNGVFGFGAENANNAYVFVAQRRPTGVEGPCPENYPNDCQDDVFDLDVDGEHTGVYVQSCAVFVGARHVHCPEGGECAPGDPAPEVDLGVTDAACTQAGYALMNFWGKFAFQTTRPAHWLIDATPAYAATGITKFGAFSPVVLSEETARTRKVVCEVTANYPSGSEGTICNLSNEGEPVASCTTVTPLLGGYTSSCVFGFVEVPEDIVLFATANKTGTNGAYTDSQDFEIGPANPARGGTATVEFDLQPPRGGKKKN